ncbi:MAG: hypothetical protein H8E66_04010 [Planctomycetes bacterium]|nr:hypothetical protein [Planctomycetota bacterium]
MLRECLEAKQFVQRKERKHGKSRAMTMLARKIGRAVYQMLKRKEAFDIAKFLANQRGAGGGAARITQVTDE